MNGARFLSAVAALVCLAAALAGCAGPEGLNGINVVPADSSILADASLPVGEGPRQFLAVGYFNNQTHRDISSHVTWSSSAPEVATIDGTSGLTSAVSVGTTTITATTEDFRTSFSESAATGTLTLIVSPTVLPADPALDAGAAVQFSATGAVTDKRIRDITGQVVWSSSDATVATVDAATGLATAVGPGTATITAVLGGVVGSTTLRVPSELPVSLSVTPAGPATPAGFTRQFSATATYSDGTKHDVTASADWTSSDASVASVDGSGLAVAVAPGTAAIRADVGGISAEAALQVSSAALTSVAVVLVSPMPAGVTQQLAALGRYSDGRDYDVTAQVAWASSTPSAVTVDAAGRATAVAAGSTTLTAALGGISSAATGLEVGSEAPTAISVRPTAANALAGAGRKFTAVGEYSAGMQYDISSLVTWSSSDSAIATVDASGAAAAVSAGAVNITVTLGDQTAIATLTVTTE